MAVVIVTHQGSTAMLDTCVSSVRSAGGASRVVIVDNSEPTERIESTERIERDDTSVPVDVLRRENRGFGAAANAGFAAGESRYVALLNDDIEVEIDWLRPLVEALEADEGLGAVQPKLLLGEREPPVDDATVAEAERVVNSVGVELDANGAGNDIGYGEPDGAEWADGRAIAVFTGGAVVFRRQFLEQIGGFDERYFLYYEDVDLALRGAERGWAFRCEPSSVVWHRHGSSASLLGDELVLLQERNRLWVALRFGAPRDVARACWLSIRRLRHRPRRIHLRALVRGLGAAPRILTERRRARNVAG